MSKKHNTLAKLLLLLVGIVMVLEGNNSNELIFILIKLVGLAFTISGSYMMHDGGTRNE